MWLTDSLLKLSTTSTKRVGEYDSSRESPEESEDPDVFDWILGLAIANFAAHGFVIWVISDHPKVEVALVRILVAIGISYYIDKMHTVS